MTVESSTGPRNPFPGLRPFGATEEHLFFGREDQVNAMVDKLSVARFLSVVGTSGSGKSSLVNSGLRPALHRGLMASAGTAWRIAQFRPGNRPIEAMARALAADGVLFPERKVAGLSMAEMIETTLRMSKLGLIDIFEQAHLPKDVNLLVVADQFEELFRYRNTKVEGAPADNPTSADATAFINLLLEVSRRPTRGVFVVVTMRSDFLGDCSQFPGLAEAVNAGQYLVPRMSRDQRRAAIVGPVGVGGAEISRPLVTRLVNDVGDNPDQLSILQHALNRTWASWERDEDSVGPIELEHYESVGAMEHALDRHAEEVYGELGTERLKLVCKRVFMALTDKATDPRGVRRPTTLGTLCELTGASQLEVVEVIDVFRHGGRSFLMPPEGEPLEHDSVIDISHESLMRVWKRLGRWADEEAESARRYRRLADSAERHEHGDEALLRNPDLALNVRWWDANQPNQAWANRYDPDFERAARYLNRSKQAGTRRRILAIVGVAAMAILTVMAVVSAGTAREAQQRADEEATQSSALELAAHSMSLRGTNPALALVLAAESTLTTTSPLEEASGALFGARIAFGERVAQPFGDPLRGHTDRVFAVAFSPDGTLVASGSDDETVRLWDPATGEQIGKPLTGHTGAVRGVGFNPDGTILATGDVWMVRLWDPATGEQIADPLSGHSLPVRAVTFNPDGTVIASASDDETVRLWDPATGEQIGDSLTGHTAAVSSVAFSPDGSILASASDDETVRLWDPATGEQIGDSLTGHTAAVSSVAFNADGSILASASDDETVRLWDPATGEQIGDSLTGHTAAVSSVAFNADGSILASASGDQTVRLWDPATGVQIGDSLTGHAAAVSSVAFSPDGTVLASASDDKTVQFWDPVTQQEIGEPIRGHTDWAQDVAFNEDGTLLASASDDKTVRLWDLTPSIPVSKILEGHEDRVRDVAFAADGTLLASASDDRTVRLWDPTTGEPVGEPLVGHAGEVRDVAFSPDGTMVASASFDKTVRLWDPKTGEQIGESLTGHEGRVRGVAFSPDGTMVASASDDNTVRLWDPKTGEQIGIPLTGHTGAVRGVAFSPDGTMVASASEDNTVGLWDTATGGLRELLEGHDKIVVTVAFSPDGTVVASASHDETVRLWNPKTGEQIGESLTGHEAEVRGVAFNPDGTMVASASADQAVRLWDTQTGTQFGEPLTGHKDWAHAVAFNPDGTMVASASSDQTVRLWDSIWDVKEACQLADPHVRAADLKAYLPVGQEIRGCTELT